MTRKQDLFLEETPRMICQKPKDRRTSDYLRGVARLLETVLPDDHHVIEQEIIPGYARGIQREPRTFMRHHGWFLELRRTQVSGKTDIFKATPYNLLGEACTAATQQFGTGQHWPASTPIGYEWYWPKSSVEKTTVPWLELLEGALLHWYDMKKYPLENAARRKSRLTEEVKSLSGPELTGRILEQGINLDVTVPSRHRNMNYNGIIYQIPVDDNRSHVGRNWRGIMFQGGGSKYEEVLHSSYPSAKQRSYEGRRHLVTAEHIAEYYKAAEYLDIVKENRFAKIFSPFPMPTRKLLNFHSVLCLNAVVQPPGSEARALTDAEKNLLIGWFLVNNKFQAGYQSPYRVKMLDYDLGPQGRTI